MPNPNPNPNRPQNDQGRRLEKIAVLVAGLAALASAAAAGVGAWQASISSDTAKRQLRAYVGVTAGGIENFGDQQKQVFTIIRKNYGATPAYDLISPPPILEVIHIGARTSTVLPAQPPSIQGVISATLFPTMELPFYIRGSQNISKQQFDLVRIGTEYELIYYGIVFYNDAFGALRYTHYCWMFRGENMTSKDAEGCIGYNDSN
jgi:hypothetical protein